MWGKNFIHVKNMKKILKLFIVVLLIVLVFGLYYKRIALKERFFNFEKKQQLPQEVVLDKNIISHDDKNVSTSTDIKKEINKITTTTKKEIDIKPIPDEYDLKVPFTIQSPDQKWIEPYKEACEEASILMLYSYFKDKDITVSSAISDIDKMIAWQMENYKNYIDSSATTTAYFGEKIFNTKFYVVKINSIEDLKKYISNGKPVAIPTLGRELKNPNFKSPGPLYHMLVVKGYTKDGKFITNDPGTRKGKDYLYDENILFNAIADFDYEIARPNAERKVGIIY